MKPNAKAEHETAQEAAEVFENAGKAAEQSTDAGSEGSDLQKAQARIEELEKQLTEEKNRYMYLYADFENFRKRSIKERSDLIKFGWEPAARELLEVIDNIERALTHMSPDTDKTLVDGLHMVMNQFRATLGKHGVQPVQAEGQPFDPNLHEAVAQAPHEKVPEGAVIQEHLRGYTLHDRLLRPARVVVSSGNGSKITG